VIAGTYAAVFVLPRCDWCGHPLVAHWSDTGCQTPTGPDSVCGCTEVLPDEPDPSTEEPAA
jgi:hypothetical protein